jgi:hypothetical protein
MAPIRVAVPTPLYTIPPQQNRYSPDTEFQIRTAPLESSCMRRLKMVTVNEHVAVFPAPSVAVQVTVVVPTGNADPDGGTQAAVAPEHASLAVGAG